MRDLEQGSAGVVGSRTVMVTEAPAPPRSGGLRSITGAGLDILGLSKRSSPASTRGVGFSRRSTPSSGGGLAEEHCASPSMQGHWLGVLSEPLQTPVRFGSK